LSETVENPGVTSSRKPQRATAPEPIETSLPASEVQLRLQTAAKRGNLPGYAPIGGAKFRVPAFGMPFDHEVIATIESAGPSQKTRIAFSIRMLPKLPIIFAIALLLTIEPGQTLVDMMIPGSWGWIDTRIWYYPVTIIPIPFAWRAAMRKSRAGATEHARLQAARIASFVVESPANHTTS